VSPRGKARPRRSGGPDAPAQVPAEASFAELVWASVNEHFATAAGEIETAESWQAYYEKVRHKIEAGNEDIQDVRFAPNANAGVCWSIREPEEKKRLLYPQRNRRRIAIHVATDERSAETSPIVRLLHDFDRLTESIAPNLASESQRVCGAWIFGSATSLLNLLETRALLPKGSDGRPTPASLSGQKELEDAVLRVQRSEFARTKAYAADAGRRESRLVYFVGLLYGLVALIPLLTITGLGLDAANLKNVDLTVFLPCIVMGAVGAALSVLMRMKQGTLRVRPELGAFWILILGAIRPVIGAVFAAALFWALKGGILSLFDAPSADRETGYFAFIGFLAGFNERWVTDTLGGVTASNSAAADSTTPTAEGTATDNEQTVGAPPDPAEPPAAETETPQTSDQETQTS
jgi:hypothetical protein